MNRRKGQGSVHTAGDKWRIQVDIGINPTTGKRQRLKRTAKTKAEAEAIAKLLMGQRDEWRRRSMPDRRTTFAELAATQGSRSGRASARTQPR